MPRFSAFHETRSDASLESYKYFREEISREDRVASQRITYSLALQGLLIASMTLIISGGISKDVPTIEQIIQIRQFALFCICAIGFGFSVVSIFGIKASLDSTASSIDMRKNLIDDGVLDAIEYFPNAHGIGSSYQKGKYFPYFVMGGFVIFWLAMSLSVLLILSGRDLPGFQSAKLQSDIKKLQAPMEVRVIDQKPTIQPSCQFTSIKPIPKREVSHYTASRAEDRSRLQSRKVFEGHGSRRFRSAIPAEAGRCR